MGHEIAILFERLLPESLHPYLANTVGRYVRVQEGDSLFRVCASGYFSGAQTADLLNFARSQDLTGALIVADADEDRVLYFQEGRVAGAHSTVLFEQLGRILLREGLVPKDLADDMVEREETTGIERVIGLVPDEVASYGLERRIWDVATALYFSRKSHFLIIEGACDLQPLPTFSIEPVQLAMEGMRSYDEWRNAPGEATSKSAELPSLGAFPELTLKDVLPNAAPLQVESGCDIQSDPATEPPEPIVACDDHAVSSNGTLASTNGAPKPMSPINPIEAITPNKATKPVKPIEAEDRLKINTRGG